MSNGVRGLRQQWIPHFSPSFSTPCAGLAADPARTAGDGPVHLRVRGLVQDTERGHLRRGVQHCIQCSHKETCCVQENVHSTLKLKFWNAHSHLIGFWGNRNAAQVRTNELWENEKHNWGKHKVFPEELLWDVIFRFSKSREAQMRVKKFFEMTLWEWQPCSVWNQSTTRNVTGQSQPSMSTSSNWTTS